MSVGLQTTQTNSSTMEISSIDNGEICSDKFSLSKKEEECIFILQQKIKGNKELQHFNDILTDRFLLHFIRGRKYNSEFAYDTIVRYFHLRKNKYPDLFCGIVSSQMKIKHFGARPLAKPSASGSIVFVSKKEWWPHVEELENGTISLDDALQLFVLYMEQLWQNPDAEINGMQVIFDLSSFTNSDIWRHARAVISISHIFKALSIFYKGFPMRYKNVHYVHPPTTFGAIISIMNKFGTAKMNKRVKIHQKLDTLYEELPKSILPKWLGGELTDEEAFDWSFPQNILKNEEYYLNFRKLLK